MKQMTKVNQNSPKSCQSKPQKPLRWHLNDVILEEYTMEQTLSMKHQPFKALKEHQMQAYKHATRTEMML